MTKADIVSRIIEQTGVEKATALAVVESFMEQVKNALTDGESVYLRGFGTFLIKQRAAKRLVTFQRIRRSLYRPTPCRHSSPRRSSLRKSNDALF